MKLHLIYCSVVLLVAAAWAADRSILRSELTRQWGLYTDVKAQRDLLDPIRWEVEGGTYSQRALAACKHMAEDMDRDELHALGLWCIHAAEQKFIEQGAGK